jgi:hypothetical protein
MPPWPSRPRGPSRSMTRMPRGPHREKRQADVIGEAVILLGSRRARRGFRCDGCGDRPGGAQCL